MSKQFVHLHVHSHYSNLDGVSLIEPLIKTAKELQQPALAITDHGVMYGVVEFYQAAKKYGVKPIIGMEAYIAPKSRKDREQKRNYHLTLLAYNYQGYKNLSLLSTKAFLDGFYYRPRIDKELLAEYSEGLIGMSGCLAGEIPQKLLAEEFDEALQAAYEYENILGKGNFFLEIMDNGIPEQKRILEPMREISNKTNIPLVATADVHYIKPEFRKIQDILLCISSGKRLDEEKRLRAEANCYLKSAEEMSQALIGFEDAVERTVEIAGRCDVELPLSGFHLPKLIPPDGMSSEEYMTKLSLTGLKKKYNQEVLPKEVMERFEKEKEVIVKMGFADYFLIVWDVVNFARENNIPVGPGRGSAAGSIISYGLGITSIDPLKYGLYFERFLNEGRNEMPDIDLDFDKESRQEVVAHIIKRHGADHCAKIITFGCLSLKSGVRDVGRVMSVPLERVNKITKMIPDMLKTEKGLTPVQTALKQIPELKAEYDSDPEIKEVLDITNELEGVLRNTGIHAAGVLVADKPIYEYGPLAQRDGEVTTQYEMKTLEKLGLCKIDILGLETLTLIKNALAIIKENCGVEIDIDNIKLDDKETFEMLSRGDSKGVFQFESEGFRQLLANLKPDVFEDLIAAVAIYRPGPLQFLNSFINRKHKKEPIQYLHPLMENILKETYGLILYQEQVQALALELAHFTLSEGDLMRRAMGKKDAVLMAKYRDLFIEQAKDTIGEKIAAQAYDQIQVFAGYGFNKSHSACYALIAYQTAYLKCHYPKEYMAALLTINRGDANKIVMYAADSKKMGIDVLPVDINNSGAKFMVKGDNITYALSAVKGVGDSAAQMIEEERIKNGCYKDLFDFAARIDSSKLNKGAIEALIKSGALDSLHSNRAQMLAGLDSALAVGNSEQKDRASGQMGLFANLPKEFSAPALPVVDEWEMPQKLAFEKEVLGFYASSHPLAEHNKKIDKFSTTKIADLIDYESKKDVIVGGLITQVKQKTDKKNRRYVQFILEDLDDKVLVMAFSKIYEELKEYIAEDKVAFVVGKVDNSRDEPCIIANNIIPLENAEKELATAAVLTIAVSNDITEKIIKFHKLNKQFKGNTQLHIEINTEKGKVVIKAGDEFNFKAEKDFIEKTKELFGANSLRLLGKKRI